MKFLALSDAHGVYSHIAQLLFKAGDVDAVCVIGDITDFGPNALVQELLSLIGEDVPTLMIPGNCDLPTIVETIEESPAVNLHLKSFDYDDIRFLGIGGSNPTPFNTPFELSEAELQSYAARLLNDVGATTVLLSHTPPKGFLDAVDSRHVGSEAILHAVGIVDVTSLRTHTRAARSACLGQNHDRESWNGCTRLWCRYRNSSGRERKRHADSVLSRLH